jgi:predicted transcriptional regulator
LSIARRTGEICAKGTVKASWIAGNFGLSRRAVKYAQAELRQLGWITKDSRSHQLKLNRDGAYFVINLNWNFEGRATNMEKTNSGIVGALG